MQEQDELDIFIDDILTAKNLSGVTDEVRKDLVADMKSRLLDQVNKGLIAALPEDKFDEFDRLLDDENVNEDQIQQFIVDSGVDVQKVTVNIMLRFRDLYLNPTEESEE